MSSKPISITLPEELLSLIEAQVESGQFASVSEYIRHSVRLALGRGSQDSGDPRGSSNTSNSWLTGKVQRGQQLGGKLGFPTINLDPTLLPATLTHGVYAAEVEYDDQVYLSAAHFGPRKTLGEWKPTLEFHLLDFDQHIPGAIVRFRLLEAIRSTLRFDSLDELKAQLKNDVETVRKYFAKQKVSQ